MISIRSSYITFNYNIKPFYFPDRKSLKKQLFMLFKEKRYRVQSLHYIFCSDDYLLNINKTFLKHHDYTDVITFDLNTSNVKHVVSGEIYISIDRVKENAVLFKTSFHRELLRVIVHGALHLCGYNDKTIEQKKHIRIMEDEFIAAYLKSVCVSRGTR